ncbi:MAG: HAD family phosphatase [Candidatus Marinimicrobia bacterium]|nr:HAD family phosphatase [Candidatus Neomarinimicrobiota bacterium]
MIRTIFFDLGNVIVSVDKDLAIRELAQLPGLSISLVRQIADSQLEMNFEQGLLSISEYMETLRRDFGISEQITVETLIDIWQKPFELMPEVCRLVPVLKTQVRLILLSNTNDLHIRAVRKKTPILDEFDDLVLSYQVKSRKPDEAIYRKALAIAKRRPEECLLIDDLIENVTAARQVGIRSHQYKTIHELYVFLEESGLRLN